MTDIYAAIEKKNFAAGIFLDLSKAFDTVNHSLLLDKLEKAGIRGIALKLLRSYLTGRTQFVSVNGVDGVSLEVEMGVPQGSVLGPLLYLIFINDIGNLPLNGKVKLFADDCALSYDCSDENTCYMLMQHDLSEIGRYFEKNHLTLNIGIYRKSKHLFFRQLISVITSEALQLMAMKIWKE
jgi:retron-type reverse transcriptase